MRSRRSPRTLAVGFALALVTTGCVSSGPSVESGATSAAVTTTSSTPAASSAPAAGETEVQVVSRLPLLPVEWRTVELDQESTGAWLMSLVTVDGEFVATASAWDPDQRSQTVYQWRSHDTVTWTRTETVLTDAWINQVLSDGDRLVALGSSADPTGPGDPRLWIDEGQGWEARDLGPAGDTGSSLYLYGAAATAAGLVLAGDAYPYEPIDPTVLSTGGFRIEIDDNTGTYVVIEEGTSVMRSSGPLSDIYRWGETGQILYDPVTGDVLTEVPWDRWSELYPGSSPLPIAVAVDPAAEPPSLEYDGLRITIDDANGVFEIVRLDSGEVMSGTLEQLYRGLGPRFIDDQTGEVVLELSWDEWDELMSRSWADREEDHAPHETETVVLFSPDSVTWEKQTLNLAPNAHLETVAAVEGRFVITVVEHFETGSSRTAWVSDDGRSWEAAGVVGPDGLSQVVAHSDTLAALADWSGRRSAVSSTDGLTWRAELSLDVQSDGREAWLDLIGAGPLGIAVSGTIYPTSITPWLAVTVGTRTARFGPEWAVEIIDTGSGEVVLALTWDQIENPTGDPPVVYREEATWFYDADRQLVLRIPDDDVYAAYEAQSQAIDQQVSTVVFVKTTGGTWFETTPAPATEHSSSQQLAVGRDAVVIGQTTWQPGEFDDADSDAIQMLVGTPAG